MAPSERDTREHEGQQQDHPASDDVAYHGTVSREAGEESEIRDACQAAESSYQDAQ
jgi:hypothetical protein